MFENQILSAVASGNLDNFQNYLKNEGNIKFVVEKDSLLHVACRYGHLNIARELLKSEVDCGYQHPSNQRIPLHEACATNNIELVELITRLSIEFINCPDKTGLTPAHICAMEGELDNLKILKINGADFSIRDKDGMTLTHWAAKRNHSSIIYYLFELDTDINEKCHKGKTALHYAAMYNSIDSLELLIKCQADITHDDNDGYTCIHMAAKYGSIKCLRLLASLGIPIDIKRSNGITPAHLAALQGHYECLHWLLDHGADISAVDGDGNSIGHYACRGGHGETMHCYLSHNGFMDLKNKMDEDVYQIARRYGNPVKFEKARKSEIVCPICQLESNKRKWDQIHVLPTVVKTMNNSQKTLFKNPLGSFARVVNDHQKRYGEQKIERNRKNLETINIGKISHEKIRKAPLEIRIGDDGYRDLITRYYGEHIHNK